MPLQKTSTATYHKLCLILYLGQNQVFCNTGDGVEASGPPGYLLTQIQPGALYTNLTPPPPVAGICHDTIKVMYLYFNCFNSR